MIRLLPRPAKDRKPPANPLWRLSGMGLELATHILAGTALGWVLDRWLGTKPTILIIGAIAGVIVGMTEFIRSALKAQKQAAQRVRRGGLRSEEPSPPAPLPGGEGNGRPMSREVSADDPGAGEDDASD